MGSLSNNTSASVPGIEMPRPPRNISESEAHEFLSATQTASVRDWVNQMAASTRMLAHGQLFPGVGNQHDPVYGDYHRWQIEKSEAGLLEGVHIGELGEAGRRPRVADDAVGFGRRAG